MKIRSKLRIAAALLLAGALSSCSSVGKTVVTKEMTQTIPAGKSVAVSVRSTAPENPEEQKKILPSLGQELSIKLKEKGRYKSVVNAPEPADYAIDVKIVKVNIVSPGARVMLGMMAGRSYIKVNVEVRNKAPEQLLGSFEVIGYGARNWMSAQGYGADDPIRKIVEQVMAKLG